MYPLVVSVSLLFTSLTCKRRAVLGNQSVSVNLLCTKEELESQVSAEECLEDNWENKDPVKGDFVTVYLVDNCGRQKEFVAHILDMDDDNLLAQLQFMQKADEKDLYYWPAADDISWESFSQILVVLGKPLLCDVTSTNRRQFFRFSACRLSTLTGILQVI